MPKPRNDANRNRHRDLQKIIIFRKTFHFITLGILNILIHLKFGLSTMVPTDFLVIMYGIIPLGPFMIFNASKKLRQAPVKNYVLTAIIPGLFNLFFVLNYNFSDGLRKESYAFEHIVEEVISLHDYSIDKVITSSIILEDNEYQNYPHIRYFIGYYKVERKHSVTYNFEEGLLGLRVMKGYRFR